MRLMLEGTAAFDGRESFSLLNNLKIAGRQKPLYQSCIQQKTYLFIDKLGRRSGLIYRQDFSALFKFEKV